MREGLRKVPQEPPPERIVLLREQPDIVGQPAEPLEERARLRDASLQDVVVRQPEGAGEEDALTGGKPVDAGARPVPHDEPIAEQFALDRPAGTDHPRVVSRKKAAPWQR